MISVLLGFFAVVVLVNCIFYFLFGKLLFIKKTSPGPNDKPISVIVCAKNEAENLRNYVPILLSQHYPQYEIILINDASTDDTLEVIKHFASLDSRIKIVDVVNNEAFWGNKKYALTLGIKKAKYNHLLFIDADCKPASNQWIQHMAGQFTDQKQLVLGYGPYFKKKGFLNTLIRFETAMTALQYMSFAKWGLPYMGVGRNLAYTSELFYANRGFMSHMRVRSGDDDLFVNEAATTSNTALCIAPDSFSYSLPKNTWNEWIMQKRRHLLTAYHYKLKHKIILALYAIFNVLFWLFMPVLFIFESWMPVLILVAFRFLVQYLVVGLGIKKLKESGIIPFIPFLEIVLIFSQILVLIKNKSSQPVVWK